MTKLGAAIERLHDAERTLARDYETVGERHAAEHDVHHLVQVLAQQCEGHAAELRQFGGRYPAPGTHESVPTFLAGADEGRPAEPGLRLLDDLRGLFLGTQDVAVRWVVIRQAALAKRDRELLALATACHEETTVQTHWLLTRMKEAAPQALTV